MANRFRITCITKPHPHSPVEHITHVGGYGVGPWTLPVETVMERIEADTEQFYVKSRFDEADVIVVRATPTKRKHIRTVADQTKADNLLELPPCP